MPTLDSALIANRQAVVAFLTKACTVPAERWVHPVEPGKWSPAQIDLGEKESVFRSQKPE